MSGPRASEHGLSAIGPRIVTAIVFALIVIGTVIFGGPLGLAALLAIFGVLAGTELFTMAGKDQRVTTYLPGLAAIAAVILASAQWGSGGLLAALSALLLIAFLWHVVARAARTVTTAMNVFGAVYVGVGLSHLVLISALDRGVELVLATILSVWAHDVFAYLAGSAFGKRRMAPHISPNKSWEGFFAGSVGTILIWVGLWLFFDLALSLTWIIAIGFAVTLTAVSEDLFESKLKREAGIKDSGSTLPGHGGFLDRIDSLLLVPIVAYYLLIAAGIR